MYVFVCEKKGESPGPASVASAIHWAQTHNRQVDMFVVLSNYMVETAGARTAVNKYRSDMKLPNTKYVPFLLCYTLLHSKVMNFEPMSSLVLILYKKNKEVFSLNKRALVSYSILMRANVK